jgi:hypothetical protein
MNTDPSLRRIGVAAIEGAPGMRGTVIMRRRAAARGAILALGPILTLLGAGAAPKGTVVVVAPGGPDRGARQPQAAVDDRGRIFVVFGVGNVIRCAASADGGRTFGTPGTVGSVPALSLGRRRGPRIAAAGGSLVITAIGGARGKGQDGDLLAWRSTDAGASWAGPVRVNGEAGSAREGLHGMAGGPDGLVFCTWLDLRSNQTEVYGALSRDGGATWEADRRVYRSPNRPKPSVCECCHPSAAFAPDGTLHVMWRNQLDGARDLYLARSSDRGLTFSPAEKLGEGTWPLNACPMDGGAIAAGPGGEVETVWLRDGAQFAAAPGRPERRLGPGGQGWAAFGPGGPFSAWLGRERAGAGGPTVLMAQRPGRASPEVLAPRADFPVVASALGGRGPVVAVWESTEGPEEILAAVLSPAPKD